MPPSARVRGDREACICLHRPSREPRICIRLICYDLDGNEGPCDEESLDLEWTDDGRRGEICLGFADGIKREIDEAEGPVVDDLLEDAGYDSVDELIAELESCCDAIINAVVAGECDDPASQYDCLELASTLAPWFEDEQLEEAAAIFETCPPEDQDEPIGPRELVLPIQPPSPGDSPSNPIVGVGLFDRGPYKGVDGKWYKIVGAL